MSEVSLQELNTAIVGLDRSGAKELTAEAIEGGTNPLRVVEEVLRPSLDLIGRDFEAGDIFLPELVSAGNIAVEVGDMLEDAIAGTSQIPSRGSIAIGTVKGDIHSIGKNIVAVIMKAFGYKVVDLGVDVRAESFVDVAAEVDVIALSGLLTLATRTMKETVSHVNAEFPGTIMIAGGAAMNPVLARELGILYGTDAASGVRMISTILEGRE